MQDMLWWFQRSFWL